MKWFATLLVGFLAFTASNADEIKVHIHGSVQSVSEAKKEGKIIGTFLIHGDPAIKTEYDKASVKVTKDTKISIQMGKETKAGKFSDIRKDSVLKVEFTGPVAESYPVQAIASKIVIVNDSK